MCHLDICHYRCGHAHKGKVKRCQSYYEIQAEASPVFCCQLFRRRSMDCRDLMNVNQDIATVCSVTCAKRQLNMQKMREKELWQCQKELEERALASAREYEQNKRAEEEALRLQRVERAERIERAERMERAERVERDRQERERGKSREQEEESRQQRVERARRERGKPIQSLAPLPQTPSPTGTAHAEMGVYTRVPSQRAAKRPSPAQPEVLPAPPRLGERRIHPYYRPPSPPNPNPVPEANNWSQTAQTRMPFQPTMSRADNSISRSNGRHFNPGQTEALDDPRTRIQASRQQAQVRPQAQLPPTRTVPRGTPMMISRTASIPESYCASPVVSPTRTRRSSSTTSSTTTSRQRSQQPPTQRPRAASAYEPPPPVPPKDTTWKPRHPNLVPPPLALGPRPPAKATTAPPTTAPQRRKPLAITTANPPQSSAPTQTHPQQTRPINRSRSKQRPQPNPNPNFTFNPTTNTPSPPKHLVKKPNPLPSPLLFPSLARSSSRARAELMPVVQARTKGWLKNMKLMMGGEGGAGSSAETMEWVSADAIRVERGSLV